MSRYFDDNVARAIEHDERIERNALDIERRLGMEEANLYRLRNLPMLKNVKITDEGADGGR